MKSTDNLGLFGTLIGAAAASGNIATVPDTQATSGDGTASIALGFPPETFIDRAAGGEPPRGQDMNGFLNRISRAIQVLQAGYFGPFNTSFAAAIGGYPSGAIVSGTVVGTFWVSTADNNTSTPGANGASWQNLFTGYLPLPGGTLTGPLYVRTDGGIGVSLTGVSGGPITSGNTPWSPQFETILNGDGSLKGVWCVRDKVGSYPYLSFQLTDQQGNWYELQYRSDDRLYTSSGKRFLIDADLSGYATTANMLSAGRLLKNTIYTTVGTSTFTPDTKTQWIVVEVQGGGGAGGGCAQTSSNQQAASWGGTAGAYGRSGLYSASGLTGGVLVTVGAGGSPASGAAGGNGGASSFGSLVTASGGAGGGLGPANIIGSSLGADGAVSSDATGPALLLSQRGSGGSGPIALGSQTTIRGGTGGRSFLGPGGNGPTGSTSNAMPGYLGGGGSGQALGPSAASSASGGSGGSGCVIVWEYA